MCKSHNSNSDNSNGKSSVNSIPTTQDLMVLLSEQAKVINSLQKTIESLNETIKDLKNKVINESFNAFKIKCKQLLL